MSFNEEEEVIYIKMLESDTQPGRGRGGKWYQAASNDTRCCGLCYYCCPIEQLIENKNPPPPPPPYLCPTDLPDYFQSVWVYTDTKNGGILPFQWDLCCFLCFPIKFAFCWPGFFGAILNQCINNQRGETTTTTATPMTTARVRVRASYLC
jgi:hypothetical protein